MTTFKKINNWLHLWLGLISGIIVFIVCITGCIWVFNEEITALLEPGTRISKQDKAVLTPSQIRQIATGLYPGKRVAYTFYKQGRAVEVYLGEGRRGNIAVKLNPYTGEVISQTERKPGDVDFFRFILNGHRALWFPYEIGRPIVNYATLVFVILLITGLIWWYPKKWTQSTVDKSFKIKWGASFKRLNLDLHNVLGFYSLLLLMAIALTGMVYGIEWYSKSLYWVTTGGQSLPKFSRAESDTLQANFYPIDQAMDDAWAQVIQKHPASEGFYYIFPDTAQAKSVITITIYPSRGQFYNNMSYTFDRYTLRQLPTNELYDTSFEQASFGGKLRRMNYDIHVGSILGFPGKVLAFLSTLIGATLPITGFIIWWNRKGFGNSKKRTRKAKRTAVETNTQPSQPAETQKVPLGEHAYATSSSPVKPVYKPKMHSSKTADGFALAKRRPKP